MRKYFFQIAISVLVAFVFVAVTAYSATTISTNINTGGTLTVSGASTLTGAVWATSTLQVTGAITTYGNATFGDAIGDVNLFTGILQASTTALFGGSVTFYDNVTIGDADSDTFTIRAQDWTLSTTATGTVTMTNGLEFKGAQTTLTIDPNASHVGVNTTAPNTEFEVVGTASSTKLVVGGDITAGDISGIVFGTCAYAPATAITASTTLSTNCTGATGVRTADRVFVTPRSLENNLIFVSASSTASDVIQVSVYNTGATGNLSPASATWDWMAIR